MYLDQDKALRWWHRNVARSQYAVQGWQREKIYPDFIFAVQRTDGSARIVALEMKGAHLKGNDDTVYKRAVLQLVSEHFAHDDTVPVGEVELVQANGDTVECDLVLMPDWPTQLPGFLKPEPRPA